MSVEAVELTGAGTGSAECAPGDSGDGVPYEPAWLPTLFDLDDLLDVLDIRLGTSPVVLRCLDSSHGGILSAQLLAQQVVLAERLAPGKRVRTLHTLFIRPGRNDRVLEVGVEHLHDGPSSAALALTFRQGGEVVSRAQVLLTGDELGTAPEGDGPPGFVPPGESRRVRRALLPWEARDLPGSHSDDVGLWLRVPPRVGEDSTLWIALLAHASVVPALEQLTEDRDMAGPRVPEDEAVLSHCLTVAARVDVREWHVMQASVPPAGGGGALRRGEFRSLNDRPMVYFETSEFPR